MQQIQLSFWRRWSDEYITTLQQRKKWAYRTKNIQLGDIVLIREDNLPPCQWMMRKVIDTHAGKDDLIRVVTLRTKGGSVKRTVRKLVVLLPVDKSN